jgi:hypothetical protein
MAPAILHSTLQIPTSVMWWNFVAQIARLGKLGRSCLHLRIKQAQLRLEQINLFLLPEYRAIEFLDQILGQADLDFQFGQAVVHRIGFQKQFKAEVYRQVRPVLSPSKGDGHFHLNQGSMIASGQTIIPRSLN